MRQRRCHRTRAYVTHTSVEVSTQGPPRPSFFVFFCACLERRWPPSAASSSGQVVFPSEDGPKEIDRRNEQFTRLQLEQEELHNGARTPERLRCRIRRDGGLFGGVEEGSRLQIAHAPAASAHPRTGAPVFWRLCVGAWSTNARILLETTTRSEKCARKCCASVRADQCLSSR